VALTLAACSHSGHLNGSVVQLQGGPLSGVRVTIDGLKTHVEVSTNDAGRFVAPNLAPGSYAVKADLPGYVMEARDHVSIAGGATTSADFTLHPACLEEGSYVDGGLNWGLQAAEAVVYLRIAAVSDPDRWIVNGQCIVGVDHTATVLSILNMGPDSGEVTKTIHIVRDGRVAWKPGEEYVSFLRWEPAIGRYRPIAGPIFMIPVQDGRVVWERSDAPNIRTGDAVSKAMAGLFALLPSARGH